MTKGKPTSCNQKIANEIIDMISDGNSLRFICKKLKLKYSTVRSWMVTHADTFFAHSTRAYEVGYDSIADECIEIADSSKSPNDKRIMIDTRLRLLGKWRPKKYGDKTIIAGDADNPIQSNVSVTIEIVDPDGN